MRDIINDAYLQRSTSRDERFEEKFVWMAPEVKDALDKSGFQSSK